MAFVLEKWEVFAIGMILGVMAGAMLFVAAQEVNRGKHEHR